MGPHLALDLWGRTIHLHVDPQVQAGKFAQPLELREDDGEVLVAAVDAEHDADEEFFHGLLTGVTSIGPSPPEPERVSWIFWRRFLLVEAP